ncbi:MAG: hypothetical protein LBB18_04295, partial [Puniceicoccales bacterium]|nr:hypothetical protein [Puniceicoccales bacterium]
MEPMIQSSISNNPAGNEGIDTWNTNGGKYSAMETLQTGGEIPRTTILNDRSMAAVTAKLSPHPAPTGPLLVSNITTKLPPNQTLPTISGEHDAVKKLNRNETKLPAMEFEQSEIEYSATTAKSNSKSTEGFEDEIVRSNSNGRDNATESGSPGCPKPPSIKDFEYLEEAFGLDTWGTASAAKFDSQDEYEVEGFEDEIVRSNSNGR